MSSEQVSFSDPAGELTPAFQSHLRRLESLRTLMAQGGAVVGEVMAFLAQAQAELSMVQAEHAAYASAHERLVREKEQALQELAALQRNRDEESRCAAGRDEQAERLRSELDAVSAEHQRAIAAWAEERHRLVRETDELRAREAEVRLRLARAEAELQQAQTTRRAGAVEESPSEQLPPDRTLVMLRHQVSALELQVKAERERRARLMEMLKVPELIVHPKERRFA